MAAQRHAPYSTTAASVVVFCWLASACVVLGLGVSAALAEPVVRIESYGGPNFSYLYYASYKVSDFVIQLAVAVVVTWVGVASGTGLMCRSCFSDCSSHACYGSAGMSGRCGPEACLVSVQVVTWHLFCIANLAWTLALYFCFTRTSISGSLLWITLDDNDVPISARSHYPYQRPFFWLSITATACAALALLLQIPAVLRARAAGAEREARLKARASAGLLLRAAKASAAAAAAAAPCASPDDVESQHEGALTESLLPPAEHQAPLADDAAPLPFPVTTAAVLALTQRLTRLNRTGKGRAMCACGVLALVVWCLGMSVSFAQPVYAGQVRDYNPYSYNTYHSVYKYDNTGDLYAKIVVSLLFSWAAVAAGTGLMFRDCCRLCDESCACCVANGLSRGCGPEGQLVACQTWAWNLMCASTAVYPVSAITFSGTYERSWVRPNPGALTCTFLTTAAILLQIPAILLAPAAAAERDARLLSNARLVLGVDADAAETATVTTAPPLQEVSVETAVEGESPLPPPPPEEIHAAPAEHAEGSWPLPLSSAPPPSPEVTPNL